MRTSNDPDEIAAAANECIALQAVLDTPMQTSTTATEAGDGTARRGTRSSAGKGRRRARAAKNSATKKGVELFTGSDVKGFIEAAVADASKAAVTDMAEKVAGILGKQRKSQQHNHKAVVRQTKAKAEKRVVKERHARKKAEKAGQKAAGAARQKQGVPRASATESVTESVRGWGPCKHRTGRTDRGKPWGWGSAAAKALSWVAVKAPAWVPR